MIRLAAVNGEQTIPIGFDEMAENFIAIGESIQSGSLRIKRAVIVIEDGNGMIDYSPIGHVSLVCATGLLALASRQIERDIRG